MRHPFRAARVALVVAACLLCEACSPIATVTDEAFVLSSDWMAFTPKQPMVARGQERLLEIVLPPGVDTAPIGEDGLGRVILPDGKEATIEAQLIDRNGSTWHFDWKGWAGNTREATVLKIPAEGLPDGDVIVSVKLRSSNLIRCLRVQWSCGTGFRL